MAIDTVSAASAAQGANPTPIAAFNESDGPSFSDVLDILNPLQHIPVINSIYQHLTGDSEGAVADVAGGTLWAGPIGLVTSLVDLAMRSDGGKSASDSLLTWLGLEDDDRATALAQNDAHPANPASPAAQAAQQTAAANTAPAVLTAPLAPVRAKTRDDETRRDARADDQDGPQQRGDYLVFGAGSSLPAAPAPVAANPPKPAPNTR
jgi:hypothetical protein